MSIKIYMEKLYLEIRELSMLGVAERLATRKPTRERMTFSQCKLHRNGDKQPTYLEIQFQ